VAQPRVRAREPSSNHLDRRLRRERFEPASDDLGPDLGDVPMWEVTGVTDLVVRPRWMAGQGSACEGDRHDVVSIAVDYQHRASHVVSDSMERFGTYPQTSNGG